MKTVNNLLLLSVASIFIISCSNKKSATTAPAATNTQSQVNYTSGSPASTAEVTPIGNAAKNENMRFVVSFYSIGEGIDIKAKDEFVNLLNTNSKKISYEPKNWGREGEVDYCLSLKELSASEQTEFINRANAILNRSKLVHKKENSNCEHSNWQVNATTNMQEDIYRLVVSFYSKGEGVDLSHKAEYEKFLNNQPKKIAFEPTTWGREGETDYCLKLNELTTDEQSNFVKKSKEILNRSTLVHVNENAKCVHKQ